MRLHCGVISLIILSITSCVLTSKSSDWYDDCVLHLYVSDSDDYKEHTTNYFDCVDLEQMKILTCQIFRHHKTVYMQTETNRQSGTEYTAWEKCEDTCDISIVIFHIFGMGTAAIVLGLIIYLYVTQGKTEFQKKRKEITLSIIKADNITQDTQTGIAATPPNITFKLNDIDNDQEHNLQNPHQPSLKTLKF